MHDPYLYLEKAHTKRSVNWAKKQTSKTLKHLNSIPVYQSLFNDQKEILGDKDKTIFATIRKDGFGYAFITDSEHPLGRLRRIPAKDYLKNNDNWETLLDVGKLASEDGIKWSYDGSTLSPNKKRLMIKLSPDGGDAVVIREFDIKTKSFIDEGLNIALGKTSFCYFDDNTLLVNSTCDGEETNSTYAKNLRIVKRGDTYSKSKILISAKDEDLSVSSFICRGKNYLHSFAIVSHTFLESRFCYLSKDGKATKLHIPLTACVEKVDKTHIYLHLQDDWLVDGVNYPTGDFVSVHLKQAIKGKIDVQTVYTAPKGCVNDGLSILNSRTAIISQMKDVCGELLVLKKSAGSWHVDHKIPLPEAGSVNISEYLKDSQTILLGYENYLTPYTEYAYSLKSKKLKVVKSQKSYFDSKSMQVTQKFSTSVDGTKIPYFMIHKKGLELNGKNPTILYGYGGFADSEEPEYVPSQGKLWVENGGVFVTACIRGGAEYGPKWHTSVLKMNRHKCYEDFESIAESLITDKITSSKNIGIWGSSNGGLLVGACVTRRPDLFAAVCCDVPLLDMLRLKYIGAGESWLGEYGDPDDSSEMKAYLESYSPYHNIKANVKYPRIYFTASQADDRTHPCHARKMVARMNEQGHDILYNETVEGGHTGGTDINQQAEEKALIYSYFFSELTN